MVLDCLVNKLVSTFLLFSCKSNKMSHVKVVVCNHVSAEFNELNGRSILTCSETVKCRCTDTYGSRKVFACLWDECTNIVMRNPTRQIYVRGIFVEHFHDIFTEYSEKVSYEIPGKIPKIMFREC